MACTAHNVTPASPEALSLSLLLGDRELGEALSREVEEEPQQGEDLLFQVTGRWLLPSLDTPTPPALHCRATMTLPGVQLSHQRAIPGESLRFRAACSQCPSAPPSLDRRCPGVPLDCWLHPSPLAPPWMDHSPPASRVMLVTGLPSTTLGQVCPCCLLGQTPSCFAHRPPRLLPPSS